MTTVHVSGSGTGRKGRATRRRIVEAAYGRLAAEGYAATTMAGVASDAGVVVQTVYFFFQNKLGLFRAVWRYAVHGGEDAPPPAGQGWFTAMQVESDPWRAIAIAMRASTDILRRLAPLAPVLDVYATDPGIVAFRAQDEAIRRRDFRHLIKQLANKAPLCSGLSLDDATVILMTVMSPASYRTAVISQGWPEERWEAWLTTVVARTIFATSVDEGRRDPALPPCPGEQEHAGDQGPNG